MLKFLENCIEKRYVTFQGDEAVAVFLDRSDAFLYSQDHPLYGLEEVNCIIPPPFVYEDEKDHDILMVRILLKKVPTENDPRTQVELWCSDGLDDALIYAYFYHVCVNGGNKDNFDVELTAIDFFNIYNRERYDGDVKKAYATPFLTEILSHINKNNY